MSQHHLPLSQEHSGFAQGRAAWRLLPSRLRTGALLLLAATLIAAGLEVMGLAALAAVMSALTPGNASSSFALLAGLFGPPGETATLRLVAFCALVFFAKNAFMAAVAWAEATFAFRLYAHLSDLTVRTTLESEYEEVARKRPSELLNLLTGDLIAIVLHMALPALTLLSESLLMLAVVGFLFWAEPGFTMIVVGVLGGLGAAMVWASRRAIASQGRRRQQIEDERIRRLREIFDHLREIYIYRAGGNATRQLRAVTNDTVSVYRAFQMLSTGPRFMLEVALIGVLLSAIAISLSGDGMESLIVSVGVFAASGFRLLVGANRLIMSAQTIRFAQSSMARLLAAAQPRERASRPVLVESPPPACAAVAHQALALRDVEFRYPGASVPVLHEVSLEIRRGTMTGIKGGSGGGKTTLLEVMAGLRRPGAGAVVLDGRPLTDPGRDLFRLVGYVGQTAAVFTDTIRRNVAYGFEDAAIEDVRVWAALEKSRLADFVRGLPRGLDTELGTAAVHFSGGQAQRLALARALYTRCSFLLLDEPTSALDPATEAEVVETLCALARDCAILVVSHRPRPLLACDAVYEMRHGRLVAATDLETSGASLPV